MNLTWHRHPFSAEEPWVWTGRIAGEDAVHVSRVTTGIGTTVWKARLPVNRGIIAQEYTLRDLKRRLADRFRNGG